MTLLNKTFTISTQEMTGKDGETYHVLTTYTSGRGWAGKKYIAFKQPFTVDVTVIKDDTETQETGFYSKAIVVIAPLDFKFPPSTSFSKNPYTRKDGSFTHLPDLQYSDWNTKIDSNYSIWSYDEAGVKSMQNKYKGYEWLKPGHKIDLVLGKRERNRLLKG